MRSKPTLKKDHGSFWELGLFAILFVLVFSAIARAENSSSTVVASNPTPAVSDSKGFAFSGSLTIDTARTLSEDEPVSYSGSYALRVAAKHKPTQISYSLSSTFTQEYSYERDDGTNSSFENPVLSASRAFKQGEAFQTRLIDSLTVGLRGSLPANRAAYQRTFLGSVGPSVSAAKKLGRVNLTQVLRYTRSFFEYDITEDGRVNSPDSFTSVSDVSVDVTDKFSLGLSLGYVHAISFQGVGKGTQSVSMSAGYTVSDNVSLSLGVATDRGTLETDGQTNSIKLYDERVSQAFFDVEISI